jgi:hypothetical protein
MTIRIEKMMENNIKECRRWIKDSDRLGRERKKLDQVR